jgi:hypothetical protein
MVKIFYSYSNHNDSSNNLFEKMFEYFNKDNEIITDVDNNKDKLLLPNIIKHIESSDIFICDITPDNIDSDKNPIYNPNVMFELGNAYNYFNEENILILLNTTFSKNRPSLLEGIKYEDYENNEESFEMIKEKIEKIINNNKSYYKWTIIRYSLPELVLKYIKNIFDINYKSYDIKINPNKDNVIIFFNTGDKKYVGINIIKKKLYIDTKEIDLSIYKEIYDELKHLEIIANIKWFN